MKEHFRAYFRPSAEEFAELWQSATIVLDANFLLDLYRVSESTRSVFQEVLKRIEKRLHVPHQFALEFARNRTRAIAEHVALYDGTAKKLEEIVHTLENKSRHPFVSEPSLKSLRATVEELRAESRAQQNLLSAEDPLTTWIVQTVSGHCIGKPCTPDELKSIYEEGKRRYAERTPPGYMDIDKPEPRRYGDLVAWKQILSFAKATKSSVILVTSEQKEDWWHKEERRWTIGPRPELTQEFEQETSRSFYAYNTQVFLERAASSVGVSVPEQALEEVREVEQANRAREALDKAKVPPAVLGPAGTTLEEAYEATKATVGGKAVPSESED